MSKKKKTTLLPANAEKVWNNYFKGKGKDTVDVFGREIHKNKYNDKESEFGWTKDHVWPKKYEGKKKGAIGIKNQIPLHYKSNEEKSNNINGEVNGKMFEVIEIETTKHGNIIGEITFPTSDQIIYYKKAPKIKRQTINIDERAVLLTLCLEIEERCKSILCLMFKKPIQLVNLPSNELNDKAKFEKYGVDVIVALSNKRQKLSIKKVDLHKLIYSLDFNDLINWLNWLDSSKMNKILHKNIQVKKIKQLAMLSDIKDELSSISSKNYKFTDLNEKIKMNNSSKKTPAVFYNQIKNTYTNLLKELKDIKLKGK